MPYISEAQRKALWSDARLPASAGELNYAFTMLALDYMQRRGKSYASINDVIGALESAKLEFYRRYVAPYEDTKIAENGDVYP